MALRGQGGQLLSQQRTGGRSPALNTGKTRGCSKAEAPMLFSSASGEEIMEVPGVFSTVHFFRSLGVSIFRASWCPERLFFATVKTEFDQRLLWLEAIYFRVKDLLTSPREQEKTGSLKVKNKQAVRYL